MTSDPSSSRIDVPGAEAATPRIEAQPQPSRIEADSDRSPIGAGAEPGVAPADAAPDAPAAPERRDDPVVSARMRVRRSPRFGRFIGVGFIVGMLLGLVFDWLSTRLGLGGAPANPGVMYSQDSMTMFLVAIAGLVGAFMGLVVALVLDRRG